SLRSPLPLILIRRRGRIRGETWRRPVNRILVALSKPLIQPCKCQEDDRLEVGGQDVKASPTSRGGRKTEDGDQTSEVRGRQLRAFIEVRMRKPLAGDVGRERR